MTSAKMSQAGGQIERSMACGISDTSWKAEAAIREAERILAETERPTRNGGHIDLCDLFDAIVYRPDATAFDYSPSNIDSEARMDHIVAEAIEGAMGALDELAGPWTVVTNEELGLDDDECQYDTDAVEAIFGIKARNRATLAAMGTR